MALSGTDLYVGGTFDKLHGLTHTRLGRIDIKHRDAGLCVNRWSSLVLPTRRAMNR